MNLLQSASKVSKLPGLQFLSPARNTLPSEEERSAFLKTQKIAFRAVKEVASLMQEGWTEKKAAAMVDTYLKDLGVHAFFHAGFAWFGERAGFHGMRHYKDFMPSDRVLLPGEVFILDVAPIYQGHVADVGFTASLGTNEALKEAMDLLSKFREEIPILFKEKKNGADVWKTIDAQIRAAGFGNAYKKYPFGVIGHRVHQVPEWSPELQFLKFGWQSIWSIASRGVFGQLLNKDFHGDTVGLWAIEPHLSGKNFGAKFEEILVVTKEDAYWLDTHCAWRD